MNYFIHISHNSIYMLEIMGVFHLPKDSWKNSGNFGGKCLSVKTCSVKHTCPIHPQAPSTIRCISRRNTKWRHNCCCWTKCFSLKEDSLVYLDYDDIRIVGDCNLYEAQSSQESRFFYENILPAHTIDEALRREVQATGRVPKFLNQESGYDRLSIGRKGRTRKAPS